MACHGIKGTRCAAISLPKPRTMLVAPDTHSLLGTTSSLVFCGVTTSRQAPRGRILRPIEFGTRVAYREATDNEVGYSFTEETHARTD